MSALIPDNPLKAPLVQQMQERDNDIVRSSQQSQQAFAEELARRGNEAVRETGETDQNGVDEDPERQQSGKKKKRTPGHYATDEDEVTKGWTMGPDDDGKPHRINIIA